MDGKVVADVTNSLCQLRNVLVRRDGVEENKDCALEKLLQAQEALRRLIGEDLELQASLRLARSQKAEFESLVAGMPKRRKLPNGNTIARELRKRECRIEALQDSLPMSLAAIAAKLTDVQELQGTYRKANASYHEVKESAGAVVTYMFHSLEGLQRIAIRD